MSENDLKMVAFEFYWCCNGQSGNSSNSGSIISCFDANHKTRFCICFNMGKLINFLLKLFKKENKMSGMTDDSSAMDEKPEDLSPEKRRQESEAEELTR